MVNIPSCRFFVIQQLSGRHGGPYLGSPRDLQNRARGLGADAIMDYRAVREFGPQGNVVAVSWTAVAIGYWDRTNPECYQT